MELKTIEIEGVVYAEVQDGKPIFMDDGKDVAIDVPDAVRRIAGLNREAQSHREKNERLETNLARFKDIEDPDKARKALETVANLDEKKLIEAGEVERVKQAAVQATEAKFQTVIEERDTLKKQLQNELIGGNFSRSKYVSDNVAIPSDLLQSRFQEHFKVEDGKVVATDTHGNKIYSKQRPGELASFDEALQVIVDQYPHKENILKGRQQNGSGADHGGGRASGADKTMAQSDFNNLSPKDRAAKMAEGVKLTSDA